MHVTVTRVLDDLYFETRGLRVSNMLLIRDAYTETHTVLVAIVP